MRGAVLQVAEMPTHHRQLFCRSGCRRQPLVPRNTAVRQSSCCLLATPRKSTFICALTRWKFTVANDSHHELLISSDLKTAQHLADPGSALLASFPRDNSEVTHSRGAWFVTRLKQILNMDVHILHNHYAQLETALGS